jgi:hypothetical protein
MEREPSTIRRDSEAIHGELDSIGKDIIALNRKLRSQHEESGGNSPEDNAQEAQADMTKQAIIAEQISALRMKETELRAELAALEEKAA